MHDIKIHDVSFSYAGSDKLVLKDINVDVEGGEFVCILGQSGCGKSTLLRLIAGLEDCTTGEILVDGEKIHGASLNRGVVFQDYGLFPWKTAGANITLALKKKFPDWDKNHLKERTIELLKAVGLDESVYRKYPKELSGGMKQRCAIASAFGIDPPILLMDEPFGALDAVTRSMLQDMVLKLWEKQEDKKTVFFVTHDVDEAMILANRIIVLGQSPSNIIFDVKIPDEKRTTRDSRFEDPESIKLRNELLQALQAGQVDVTSNQGTNNPLQFISTGSDFSIVGGYMLKGMYIIGKKDTQYKDVTSLKGSKFAYAGVHPVVGMALLDAGIDPNNDVEWLTYSTNSDRLAAVVSGEADYAVLSGDQLYAVGNNDQIEIKAWLDDLVPNYGCCRMNMNTDFVKKNPTTVKLLLKSLIRAEQWYLANKEECVKILAKEIGAEEDYVAAYLLNDNYVSSVDPCKNSVVKTWEAMIKMGFIDQADADKINIEDHINTELYKEALDECVTEYHDEDPDFYDGRVKFFEENDQ